MTTGSGSAIEDGGAAEGFSDAWREVRADEAIQFEPLPEYVAPPDVERWYDPILRAIGDFFAAIFNFFVTNSTLTIVLATILAAAFAAWLIWKIVMPAIEDRRARGDTETEAEPAWVPQRGEALALLEDADRLALDGRYDEATHLLLLRSVRQISDARPGSVEASSTAREIAALPALSVAARAAFGTIAERVERSYFALRKLTSDDWQAARDAYSEFALADPMEAAPRKLAAAG
ncbi:hypothetical protein [Paraurantiacibacter namhicola]|uniref:hypothetical protein n=1 Tax=Paraurantiacibacter namhicola TaxID=645517 RepID=UPI000830380E|nr:hypothetical protein [Paraurantiacibacter namhicola]